MDVSLVDLGLTNYSQAHQFQLDCVRYRREKSGRADIFILTEHPPVFTLGKRGGRESLMVGEEFVQQQGVEIVQTERGGDITYHGPGQLVVYPIVLLRDAGLSVKDYVHRLEEVMIACASDCGVSAGRDQRNRGIWVGNNKVGSIGIRIRHGVTFHGLALNVTLDFKHFNWIQPCGLSGVGVTSLDKETMGSVSFFKVKERMILHLQRIFSMRFRSINPALITGEAA